ncbi:MAG: trypsin-like peptidase domain-containing protein [Gemmataceae bacterium]
MKRWFLVLSCLTLGGLGTYLGQTALKGQAPVAAIPKELTSYRDVVRKVLPAVVSVEAQAKGGNARPRRPDDMGLPDEMRRFFDRPQRQLPRDEDDGPAQIGFGSGFVISAKGVVVTNNHVVENADQVLITFSSGKKFVSRKIHTDPKTDLAIVQLDTTDELPTLEFGDSDQMEIGDRILAVGAPFGLAGTVTHGIISSKGRSLRMNMYEDFIQTDAAINPGNSGGPLVNLEGKVIGINSAIKSRSGGFQGIGLAISSNLGKAIVNQLLTNGVVKRGYLGVGIRDVDEEIAKGLNLKEPTGVEVTRIYPDAPGGKAGLKNGDVIVRLGTKKVKDSRELQTAVASLPVGKPVNVEVVREGKPQSLQVTIEEQPKTFGTPQAMKVPEPGRGAVTVDKIGVVLAELNPDLADALGYPDSVKGVLITRMDRRGMAAFAGIRAGMVIVSVDGVPVTTARAAATAINAGSTTKGITLQVRGPRSGVQTVVIKADDGDEDK